jgi:hypothetical protein
MNGEWRIRMVNFYLFLTFTWKFRRRDGKERRRMSGETPLGESHRAGIMQFQTKITGIEKRLIAKGIEDYPSEKAFLIILSRTETENKASTNTQVDKNKTL